MIPLMKPIKCPTCKKETVYDPTNPYRPFCSERCQLIDLGEWIEGNYRVPDESKPPEQQSEEQDSEEDR